MVEQLLSIGAFSRASSISVRTLRNYHQSGLLVPAEIDSATGYRAYSVDQLADAIAIVRLRELDVPLTMVHRILLARDPATTSNLLTEHERTMIERLGQIERIVGALREGVPAAATPAQVLSTENTITLERSAQVASAELWDWLEDSTRVLAAALATQAHGGDGIVGALYGPLEDEAYEDVTAFIAIRKPFLVQDAAHRRDNLHIGEIPSLRWAAMTHTTGFASVGETYGVLGAWVARHAVAHPTARICELYPAIFSRDAHRDIPIQIRWPINELSSTAAEDTIVMTGTYTIKALGPSTWDAFARLVQANNCIYGGCWCMSFHAKDIYHADDLEPNRWRKYDRINAGTAHAALVFVGEDCVGWCQFGSPDELPRIKSLRAYDKELVDLPDWRIACCFVGKGHRRQGVSTAALRGALDLIASLGGGRVEGYPEPVGDVPAGFMFNGALSTYERAGFAKQRKIAKHRWAVTLDVPARKGART